MGSYNDDLRNADMVLRDYMDFGDVETDTVNLGNPDIATDE